MIILQINSQSDHYALLTTIVITLFVLSMINERLVNWLKLNFQSLYEHPKNKVTTRLENNLGNFRIPQVISSEEKKRVRGIENITIFCAFFTALITKANLFYLLEKGKLADSIGFDNSLLGCFLTGLFISLGSKFWHDVLDVVLNYSNFRKKLADPNLFQSESTKELTEYLALPYNKLISNAINQNLSNFKQNPDFLFAFRGKTKSPQGGMQECIVMRCSSRNKSAIYPREVEVVMESGRKAMIPVVTIFDEIPHAHFGIGDSLLFSNSVGTTGIILKDSSDFYALTCCHVLTEKNFDSSLNGKLAGTQIVKSGNKPIGKWEYGIMNNNFDIALIRLDNTITHQIIDYFDFPEREINDFDNMETEITMLGQTSNEQKGTILGMAFNVPIKYGNQTQTLNKLIVCGNLSTPFDVNTSKSLSQGGDSGAIIYDNLNNQKHPIGIVIGGDTMFTYAMPLSDIMPFLQKSFSDLNIF